MKLKPRFTVFLPVILASLYCIVLYAIRADSAKALDENDRMVAAMALMVASVPLMPTIWLTSMVNDFSVMSNVCIFYAVTAFIQFLLVGVILDLAISVIAMRADQNQKREDEYLTAIRSRSVQKGKRD